MESEGLEGPSLETHGTNCQCYTLVTKQEPRIPSQGSLWLKELPCDPHSDAKNEKSAFAPSWSKERRQASRQGEGDIPGDGDGQEQEAAVDPESQGNRLSLNQDELLSSSQGQGQLPRQRGGSASRDFLGLCGLGGSRGCVGILLSP